ncbi:MAG: hypothetical protein VKI81_10735 [Synechococcaceae cyanobacterium]|nr:hypothetical protein [Synechococcaceae cyanobacterium]
MTFELSATALVALGLLAGCTDGRPVPETPLHGIWKSDVAQWESDTSFYTYATWTFCAQDDGTYRGRHMIWTPGGPAGAEVDSARVVWPDIVVHLAADESGGCWLDARPSSCLVGGSFASKDTIELPSPKVYVRIVSDPSFCDSASAGS